MNSEVADNGTTQAADTTTTPCKVGDVARINKGPAKGARVKVVAEQPMLTFLARQQCFVVEALEDGTCYVNGLPDDDTVGAFKKGEHINGAACDLTLETEYSDE